MPKSRLPRTSSPALRKLELQNGLVPGIGVAGQVLCPIMSLTHPAMCVKHACELWVELTYNAGKPDQQKVGRCTLAWNSLLQAEGNQALIRLTDVFRKGLTAQPPTVTTPAPGG